MRAKLSDKKFDDRFDSLRNSVNDAASYERKLIKNSENTKSSTQTGSQSKDDSAFLNKSKKFNFEQAKVLFNLKRKMKMKLTYGKAKLLQFCLKMMKMFESVLKKTSKKVFSRVNL